METDAIDVVADYLRSLVGPSIMAVIAGVEDAELVSDWATGVGIPGDEASRRLRAAYSAVRLIADEESVDSGRAWLIGWSPYLNDRSPALVIADDPAEGAALALGAAHAYLAHG